MVFTDCQILSLCRTKAQSRKGPLAFSKALEKELLAVSPRLRQVCLSFLYSCILLLFTLSNMPSPGVLGLVAFPGQGICKSLRMATHGKTRRAIIEAKRAEGLWLMNNENGTQVNDNEVILKFERAMKNGNGLDSVLV